MLRAVSAGRKQIWWRHGADDAELFKQVYRSALTAKCREAAPVPTPQIDRRALARWSKALRDENIRTLVCCVCAQKHVHIGEETWQDIRFRPALSSPSARRPASDCSLFLGMTFEDTEHLLGLRTYLDKFGKASATETGDELIDDDGARRAFLEELRCWVAQVHFGDSRATSIICCPEDIR